MLENPEFTEEFLAFMEKEHSEENFLFLLEVRKLKQREEELEEISPDEEEVNEAGDEAGETEKVSDDLEKDKEPVKEAKNNIKNKKTKDEAEDKSDTTIETEENETEKSEEHGEEIKKLSVDETLGPPERERGKEGKKAELRLAQNQEIRKIVERICNTFITENSEKYIHLQYATQSAILSQIKTRNFSPNIFDKAASEIFYNLKTDSYMRFKVNNFQTPREC